MNELFSLSISEGVICNILARARQPLLDATSNQSLYDLERIMAAVQTGLSCRNQHKRMPGNYSPRPSKVSRGSFG